MNNLCKLRYFFVFLHKLFIMIKSQINKKYDIDEHFFEDINSQEKAYFLGLMYSDGSVSDRSIIISLQEQDLPILEKFRQCIKYTGPIKKVILKNPKHNNHYKLVMYSKILVKDLVKLGCISRKTYSLKYPKIAKEYNSHFIRGLFDGDGCIMSIKAGHYFSITGLISFLKEVQSVLLSTLDISTTKISRKNKHSNLFGAIQHSKNADLIKLRTFLYKDSKDLYIKRKYDKFFKIKEKIKKVCNVCGDKHEARGFCKRCYHREIVYKKKKLITKNKK